MSETIFNSFDDFASTKNIYGVAGFHNAQKADIIIAEDLAEEHLKVISEFHKRVMGFSGYIDKRINNYTGKRVEEFKVYIRRLKRDIKKYHSEGIRSEFEGLVIRDGSVYLQRAEKCISEIYQWGYYDLIDRSMKRTEICIGNSGQENLRTNGDCIEIIDTKHVGYNMVECDCVNYLTKLKKKGVNLNWKKLVNSFCEHEGLGDYSKVFIMAMLAYPHEFMRSVNRYRYRKKDWTEQEYTQNLIEAIARDGDNLLD